MIVTSCSESNDVQPVAFFSVQNDLLVKANIFQGKKLNNLSHWRTIHLWVERTFFFMERAQCHAYKYTTRKPQMSSMFIPCSHGQLQRYMQMHVIEIDHDCLLPAFFFFSISFFASHSFCFFVLLSTFVATYVMVYSWLNEVRAMLFSRGGGGEGEGEGEGGGGRVFFSIQSGLFGQSQHNSKKNNLSHRRAIHLWVDWSRSEKAQAKFSAERECPGNAGLASQWINKVGDDRFRNLPRYEQAVELFSQRQNRHRDKFGGSKGFCLGVRSCLRVKINSFKTYQDCSALWKLPVMKISSLGNAEIVNLWNCQAKQVFFCVSC